MKFRPVVQHFEIVYRMRNSLTPSMRSMTERAACCSVSRYASTGLSLPTPYVVAAYSLDVLCPVHDSKSASCAAVKNASRSAYVPFSASKYW